MSATARLQLPLLSTGQSGKEAVVNEGLQRLDALTASAVEEAPRNDPPATPVIGDCYIVGGSPAGEWSGKPGCLAAFTSGGWKLISPVEGINIYVKSEAQHASYRAGSWELGMLRGSSLLIGGQQVVGGRVGPISEPSGGSFEDAEARTAIGQVIAALREHGLIAI